MPRPLALLLLLLFTACGGGHPSKVTGVVTLDGKPLASGTVSFHPVAAGPMAYGSISPEGKYDLKTGNQPGLAAGDYIVTVFATQPVAELKPGNPEPTPEAITPAFYRDKTTSDLKHTVAPGNNEINLDLKSQ